MECWKYVMQANLFSCGVFSSSSQVDLLPEIAQAPRVPTKVSAPIAAIAADVERYVRTRTPAGYPGTLKARLCSPGTPEAPDGACNTTAINALVLHVGMTAIAAAAVSGAPIPSVRVRAHEVLGVGWTCRCVVATACCCAGLCMRPPPRTHAPQMLCGAVAVILVPCAGARPVPFVLPHGSLPIGLSPPPLSRLTPPPP